MAWKAQTYDKRLQRIIMLLLALAGLADRAGAAPFPVRFVVLSILRHAEDVAWRFVAAAPAPHQAGAGSTFFDRNSPAEAARLALGLRMLAMIVAERAAQAPACVSPLSLRDFALAGAHPLVPAAAAFPAHDTS